MPGGPPSAIRPPCAISPALPKRVVAIEVMVETISPPFSDAANLRRYLAEKHYSRDPSEAVAHMVAFYGVSSFEELMAVPARTNSGALGTLATCWFGLFPFVGPADQWVEVDDIGITNDGYTMLFWGRWSGECSGPTTLPDGESIDLTGKSYRDLRYAYRLSFSPDTKKAVLFEGLFDVGEWGRLMDSPEFARAVGESSLYPT